MNVMLRTITFFALLCILTACYKMPTEDDYSVIPTTNNPDVTRDCGTQMLPQANF